MSKRYPLMLLPVGFLLVLLLPGQSQAVVDTLQYDDGTSFYFSGRPDPNDTCGVWFEPPTESQILKGIFQFNTPGDVLVYVWDIVNGFDPELYFDNDEPGGGPAPTPLGIPYTTAIPITFAGTGDWEEVDFSQYGYPPEDLDVGMNYFYLGYVLVGGGTNLYDPAILGDVADDRPYHSLCWLNTPGGLYSTQPGWYAYGIDWMLRAVVNLYGDPPPNITGIADPPDTYAAGPYEITATIIDADTTGVPGSGQIIEARVIYSVDGGAEVTVIMTNVGGDNYAGNIPAVGVGSRINFRVEADDDGGKTTIAPALAGYYFSYRQPSGAHILLVNDAGDAASATIYMNALDGGVYDYDYWYINAADPEDMGYPGTDVINTTNYSSLIWFNGTANPGSLPDNNANLATDPVATFMDAGGNLFFSSSDYLGGAFDPDVWTEFTALPGTFMYDYLMVNNGWSDAHVDPVTSESRDTVYYGLASDPISGDFVTPFQNHPSPNYNDFAYARVGAVDCFFTEIDAEPAGLHYDGTFKVVFLPWVLEACDDTATAEGILINAMEFFGEVGVEPVSGPTPITYSLAQNYPNPFNASTQIRFSLPHSGWVELSVYNVMNQEIARLVDGNLTTGTHVVTWDASKFGSGLYFYKIKTANFEQSRKMIMVK